MAAIEPKEINHKKGELDEALQFGLARYRRMHYRRRPEPWGRRNERNQSNICMSTAMVKGLEKGLTHTLSPALHFPTVTRLSAQVSMESIARNSTYLNNRFPGSVSMVQLLGHRPSLVRQLLMRRLVVVVVMLLRVLLVDDRLQRKGQLQRQLGRQLVRLRQRVRVVRPHEIQRQQRLRAAGRKVNPLLLLRLPLRNDQLAVLLLVVVLRAGPGAALCARTARLASARRLAQHDRRRLLGLLLQLLAADRLRERLRLLQVLVLVQQRVDGVGERRPEAGRRRQKEG
uniref:Uncharacterized protein n=1 Tax=Anopheles atroparvus TaxID=41427 RepID=A0A182ITX4_ANOAO